MSELLKSMNGETIQHGVKDSLEFMDEIKTQKLKQGLLRNVINRLES